MTGAPLLQWARPLAGALTFAAIANLASAPLRFVPRYFTEEGRSLGALGAALGAGGIGEIVAIPIAALLTRRSPTAAMALGALLQAAALAGLALRQVTALGAGGFAVALALARLATTLAFGGSLTLLVLRAPAERRAQAIALYWAVVQIARNVAGPAAFEQGIGAIGFRGTAAGFAIAALAGALAALRGARAAAAPDEDSAGEARPIDLAAAIHFSIAFGLLGLVFVAQDAFLTSHAALRGFSAASPFFFAYAAVMIAARLFLGHLPDRVGRGPILHASMLALLATFAALLAARTAPLFWAAGALAGLGNCLLWPALYAASYEIVRPRAYATAWTALLLAASGALGSVVLGALAERRGHDAIFIAGIGLCLLAWPLLFVPRRTSPARA